MSVEGDKETITAATFIEQLENEWQFLFSTILQMLNAFGKTSEK